jgi:hypothetical protein
MVPVDGEARQRRGAAARWEPRDLLAVRPPGFPSSAAPHSVAVATVIGRVGCCWVCSHTRLCQVGRATAAPGQYPVPQKDACAGDPDLHRLQAGRVVHAGQHLRASRHDVSRHPGGTLHGAGGALGLGDHPSGPCQSRSGPAAVRFDGRHATYLSPAPMCPPKATQQR